MPETAAVVAVVAQKTRLNTKPDQLKDSYFVKISMTNYFILLYFSWILWLFFSPVDVEFVLFRQVMEIKY